MRVGAPAGAKRSSGARGPARCTSECHLGRLEGHSPGLSPSRLCPAEPRTIRLGRRCPRGEPQLLPQPVPDGPVQFGSNSRPRSLEVDTITGPRPSCKPAASQERGEKSLRDCVCVSRVRRAAFLGGSGGTSRTGTPPVLCRPHHLTPLPPAKEQRGRREQDVGAVSRGRVNKSPQRRGWGSGWGVRGE